VYSKIKYPENTAFLCMCKIKYPENTAFLCMCQCNTRVHCKKGLVI